MSRLALRLLLVALLAAAQGCEGPPAPVVAEPGLDAGADAGPLDGGFDAGPDAGLDAGLDGGDADAGPTALSVLFIGNSYIYVNDLPHMLERIAATANAPPSVATDEVVVGGATLMDHWTAGTAGAGIGERRWTHVVLQGQSVEALLIPATFTDYAQRFGDLVVDAGAQPTFYVTWARAAGDAVYAETWSGGTPDAMQDGLTAAYTNVARRWPSAVLAKVGEGFRISLRERPDIVLHASDGSHPTIAGTYLGACTFYIAMSRRPVPELSEVPPGLDPLVAAYLRGVAARVAP